MEWENGGSLGLAIFRGVENAVASVLNDYGAQAGLHPLVWTLDDLNMASAFDVQRNRFHGCPAEDLELSAAMLIAEHWVRALPWDPEPGSSDPSEPRPTEKHGARRWNGRVEGAPIEIWAIVDLGVWETATTFPRNLGRRVVDLDQRRSDGQRRSGNPSRSGR